MLPMEAAPPGPLLFSLSPGVSIADSPAERVFAQAETFTSIGE